jgi:hypothetical protein
VLLVIVAIGIVDFGRDLSGRPLSQSSYAISAFSGAMRPKCEVLLVSQTTRCIRSGNP